MTYAIGDCIVTSASLPIRHENRAQDVLISRLSVLGASLCVDYSLPRIIYKGETWSDNLKRLSGLSSE